MKCCNLLIFIILLIVVLSIGVYYIYYRHHVYDLEYLEPEVFEDVNYDVDLLIGTWQSGSIFYRFDIDRVGVTWDVEDDILEAEASHLKWELKCSRFIHYYNMESGGVIPKFYTIKYLDLNKLIFIDEYANEFVFVKVVE